MHRRYVLWSRGDLGTWQPASGSSGPSKSCRSQACPDPVLSRLAVDLRTPACFREADSPSRGCRCRLKPRSHIHHHLRSMSLARKPCRCEDAALPSCDRDRTPPDAAFCTATRLLLVRGAAR